MRLRGVSSINGSSEPLIVVDGNVWETNTNNFDFQSANEEKFAELLNVNPEDIESISVLKDAAATFGVRRVRMVLSRLRRSVVRVVRLV